MHRLIRICGYVLIALALTSAFFYADGPAHAQQYARQRTTGDSLWSSGAAWKEGQNLDAPVGPLDVSLSASVGQDANGHWYAILKNSQLRVKYAYFFENTAQTVIVDFIIKTGGLNEDQAGRYLDGMADRGLMTKATVTYDGLDRKTVRLEWDDGAKVQDVSIFPDSTYIKIDYLKYSFNIVDMGSPGGNTSSASYKFYGAEDSIRGYVLSPESYYNRYPRDGLNDPADGGSLNYRGYLLGGLFRSDNNRGYARLIPVNAVDIVKLLANRGFAWYPYYQRPHQTFTGYLYTVTGGLNEILATGQQLADQAPLAHPLTVNVVGSGTVTKNPSKTNYNPGEVVTVTAAATLGWTFAGWSGDLSGKANPASLTMTASKIITATFSNSPPVLASIGNKIIASGSLLSFNVSASDPDGIIPTLSASGLPNGAAFTDAGTGTGLFAWTPTAADAGPHSVTFSASDGVSVDSETIIITVAIIPVTGNQTIFLPFVARTGP